MNVTLALFGDEYLYLATALSEALARAEDVERNGETREKRITASETAGNLQYILERLADQVKEGVAA